MQVNRERLEALLADQAVKPLEVIDRYDEAGHPAGTHVILRLPARLSF